jgi:uncharacterized repeat protein (TIGR03987 family)
MHYYILADYLKLFTFYIMKPILVAGSILVTLALISYSTGIISEFRKKILNRKALIFLGLGLLFDISGTVCMIIGSSNHAFTNHGVIGYSALAGMFIDNAIFWSLRQKNGIGSGVPKRVHYYSLLAYLWWIVVYISGFVMAIGR